VNSGASQISRRRASGGPSSTASATISSASTPRSNRICWSNAPRLWSMASSRRSPRRTSVAVATRKKITSAPIWSSSRPNGAPSRLTSAAYWLSSGTRLVLYTKLTGSASGALNSAARLALKPFRRATACGMAV